MQIFGLQKTTLLDYPGKLASIIFTGGCNMNCPFCHNSELITLPKNGKISEEEVFSHLRKRRSTLEGVVITGGECTLQKDLKDFCKKVKDLGYLIKVDTNGTNPAVIASLVSMGLIDYVAMDIKNTKEKYATTCGWDSVDLNKIQESIDYLMENHVDYEFRTTVIPEYHTPEDMKKIGAWIKGAKALYLQSFKQSDAVFDKTLTEPTKETLLSYQRILLSYINHVEIRGVNI
jgi:pyruvate formate lyase activating enzyme